MEKFEEIGDEKRNDVVIGEQGGTILTGEEIEARKKEAEEDPNAWREQE